MLPIDAHFNWMIAISSVLVGVTGFFIAMKMYKNETREEPTSTFYKAIYNKFYIDELYLFVTRNIIFKRISKPAAKFDRKVVDGSIDGIGWITTTLSERIKIFQSGQLQHYLLAFIAGSIFLFLTIIYLLG